MQEKQNCIFQTYRSGNIWSGYISALGFVLHSNILDIRFLCLDDVALLGKARLFSLSQNIFDILSLGMDTVIELPSISQ